jgi:hypothetical protein
VAKGTKLNETSSKKTKEKYMKIWKKKKVDDEKSGMQLDTKRSKKCRIQ